MSTLVEKHVDHKVNKLSVLDRCLADVVAVIIGIMTMEISRGQLHPP
jgi:hypothetical protein